MTVERSRRFSAVAIGCSTGGLHALMAVLPVLDAGLQASVIVVCHTGPDGAELLCELLARNSVLPVREAQERTRADPGIVHVAPAGYHLYLERDRRFMLSVDPKVCFVRPAIDVLFESAADTFRSHLIGVVLTGANEDGAAGLLQIRKRGGYALVQDPVEAKAPQMPEAALKIAGADEVLPLQRIGRRINELCA